MTDARGRFITLEGGEGAGKSTQIRLLADWLRGQGLDVVLTREPGGSPSAEAIRTLLVTGEPDRWRPLTESMLHFASRHQHMEDTIRPALDRGSWVVCDRFADSSIAYQGYGLGVDRSHLDALYRLAVGDRVPDLTLILDIPPETGMARAASRGGDDRYERMGLDFHRRLRAAFLDIARREPDRCVVLDADRPPEDVHASVRRAVLERLGGAS